MEWGSEVERERKKRIMISLYAYAYEIENDSLVDDGTYDKLSREINPSIKTGHKLDRFFEETFEPDTGMWIRYHPDIEGLKLLYDAVKSGKWVWYTLKKLKTIDIPE